MNDYELLKTIFDNFEVEGKKIPAEFITYTGKSKTYITYAFTDDDPTLFAEDQEVGSVAYIDIDIFSSGNYLAIEKKIKEVNTGIYLVNSKILFNNVKKIDNNNNKQEYYLTDIVEIIKDNKDTYLVNFDYRLQGINDFQTLKRIEGVLNS